MGSVDHPFNPVSLALGAEASFVARTIDSDRKHLTAVLSAAAAHRGTSLVEIYQNCPIFNDGAFDALKKSGHQDSDNDGAIIPLEHGQPIRFGAPDNSGLGAKGLVRDTETGGVKIALVADLGSAAEEQLIIHDAHNPDPTLAFSISRLTETGYLNQSPIGIFRQVQRPTYDDQTRAQVTTAKKTVSGTPTQRLAALISSGDTWTVL
jgi:2-oxoglutarate ferredoxin oxidoreductase subunit beta